MQISSVNVSNCRDNKQNFGAKIVIKTDEMKNYMRYLHENSKPREGWYNSQKDLELTQKVIEAFEKHPSKEEVLPDVFYLKNTLFNARGVLTSSRASFIDTEPARSDSIAPIQNILRRIIDPYNKRMFNRLLGEEHSHVYDAWWRENILPFWKDIQNHFREETFFKGKYDKEFNDTFMKQNKNR